MNAAQAGEPADPDRHGATANATPETVAKKRSLSCSGFLREIDQGASAGYDV